MADRDETNKTSEGPISMSLHFSLVRSEHPLADRVIMAIQSFSRIRARFRPPLMFAERVAGVGSGNA
jgi:hypothetical protein